MTMIKTDSLVLHGVGEALLVDAKGKATTQLAKLQNMSVEITAEMEDVYGGDSLFPFFNYIKSKSATFKFKDATFNMGVLALTQGAELTDGGEVIATEDVEVMDNAAQLAVTKGIEAESVIVMNGDVAMKRVAEDAVLATGEYKVTEAGALIFAEGEIEDETVLTASYVYTVDVGTTVHIKTTDIPSFVELRHISNPTELEDGRIVQAHIRVYKARCDGGFNIEQTRDGATAPEVTFKSVDPKRKDKRFVSVSIVEVKQ